MKSALIILLALAASFSSFSQTYRRVTFGVNVGKGFSDYFGPLLSFEPAYHPSDVWSVGGRLEGGFGSYRASSALLGSYSLNGYYYFTSQSLRPFVGVGFGFYAVGTGMGSKCDCSTDYARSLAGFYPSVGFSYNHLVVKIEYNIVSGGNMVVTSDMPGYPASSHNEFIKPDYMSMKVGLLIGGGRRKEK